MPYGALIWIGADEGVVPLLGLSKSSTEHPFSIHPAARFVYGLTNELVRSTARRLL